MSNNPYRWLLPGSIAFLTGNALHTADHLRRGMGLPLFGITPQVMAGGTVITVGAVAVLGLSLKRHPWAPAAAAIIGLFAVVAVSASHLAPPWGVFSKSYLALRPDALAWIVVIIEIAAGLFTGLAGLAAWRHTRTEPTPQVAGEWPG